MTTILMQRVENDVLIAYDSAVTFADNEQYELTCPKVIVNHGTIVGVAGALRDLNLIDVLELPKFDSDEDPWRWLVAVWLPAVREGLTGQGRDVDTERYGSVLMVVLDGDIFVVGPDWSVTNTTADILAVGSGADYARGALHAGATMERALTIAAEIDPGTGGKLTVTTASELLAAEAGI